jgi:phosphatidate cytidylyltransferase
VGHAPRAAHAGLLRLATAAVLAPALWLLTKRAPPLAFHAVALVLIGLACWECYRMLEHLGVRPFTWLGVASSMLLCASFAGLLPDVPTHVPFLLVGMLSAVVALWRRAEPREMLDSSLATAFPVLLVGLGLSYLVALRGIPGEDGADLLLLLFICVFFSDTGAYYVGRACGRHRMAPRVSPAKSWEGAAGGLAASIVGGLLAHFWFYQRLGLSHAVLLGIALGVGGMLGDLVESMVKRAVGVKDSSDLLPGHGGLLDRTDSLLLTGPLLYHYYRAFVQGAP